MSFFTVKALNMPLVLHWLMCYTYVDIVWIAWSAAAMDWPLDRPRWTWPSWPARGYRAGSREQAVRVTCRHSGSEREHLPGPGHGASRPQRRRKDHYHVRSCRSIRAVSYILFLMCLCFLVSVYPLKQSTFSHKMTSTEALSYILKSVLTEFCMGHYILMC